MSTVVNPSTLPFAVEPMILQDVDQVSDVDHQSFSTPWSLSAYRYEVTQNEAAHYYVAVPRNSTNRRPPDNGWLRRLRHWFGPTTVISRLVAGYGGFWMMLDEAHISTIAVRPEYRLRGIGEMLIVTMIEEAIRLKAVRVTLEVRLTNHGAQNLYTKYGFEVSGRRRAYYTDNREDALIMTVEGVQTPAYQARLRELKDHLYERFGALIKT